MRMRMLSFSYKILLNIFFISSVLFSYSNNLDALQQNKSTIDPFFINLRYGNRSYETGRYADSFKYYNQALKIANKRDDTIGIGAVLTNIGNVYREINDYWISERYYKQAIKAYESKKHNGSYLDSGINFGIGDVHTNMAKLYKKWGRFELVAPHIESAYKMKSSIHEPGHEEKFINNENKNHSLHLSHENGLTWIQINKYELTHHSYSNVRNLERLLQESHLPISARARIMLLLCELHIDIDLDKARWYMNKGKSICENNSIISGLYQAYYLESRIEKSSNKPQKAILSLIKSIKYLERIRDSSPSYSIMSYFLMDKMEAYKHLIDLFFKMGKPEAALIYAEKCSTSSYVDILKSKGINNKGENELEKFRKVYFEKIKSLWNNEQEENTFYDLPEIAAELRKISQDDAYIEFLDKPLVFVKNIQQYIGDKEAIIKYQIFNDALYIWVLKSNGTYMDKIEIKEDELKELIREYRGIMSTFPQYFYTFSLSNGHLEQHYNKLLDISHKIYKIIFAPIQDKLIGIDNIRIIPDSYLHYLSFDTLCKSKLKNQSYLSSSYLIKDYTLSYSPSISVFFLLEEMKRHEKPEENLLSFANPYYEVYSNLLESEEESEEIAYILEYPQDHFYRYYGKKASEKELYSLNETGQLTTMKYIIFSAHGFGSEAMGYDEPPFIALSKSDDVKNDGRLEIQEVFTLKLNADLVILSACNAGIGEYIPGEGNISLTRAFLYAGAKNLCTTYWRTGGKISKKLLIEMFKNIKSGQGYASALHNAKLMLLNETDELFKHPFAWGGFVLYN
jgi:CHAT domain-containing protein